jgi:hypothetical protein
LDGLLHWIIEVVDFLPNNKANATDDGGAVAVIVALHVEDLPPETPVRINAKEGFADSNEDRKVEDGVWGQLPELNPIEEKKRTEEFVRWKRKAAEKKSREHDGEAFWGFWARNCTWKADIVFRCGDESEGSQSVDVAVGNGGGTPVTANFGRLRGTSTLLFTHGA